MSRKNKRCVKWHHCNNFMIFIRLAGCFQRRQRVDSKMKISSIQGASRNLPLLYASESAKGF